MQITIVNLVDTLASLRRDGQISTESARVIAKKAITDYYEERINFAIQRLEVKKQQAVLTAFNSL